MKGVTPWSVRWACCDGTRDFCSTLAALSGSVAKYFLPHRNLFQFICPHRPASWYGPGVMRGRLSLSMCRWTNPPLKNGKYEEDPVIQVSLTSLTNHALANIDVLDMFCLRILCIS
jgi:hypothetical protein